MRIQLANLWNFRNISEAELRFAPDLNVLLGANGQGKTNTIEALYFAAALRPLRRVPRSGLFGPQDRAARVGLSVQHETTGLSHQLSVHLQGKQRVLKKDENTVDAQAFLGGLAAVAFTPDDLEITKGPPELRRRFVDRAILNARPAYLSQALRYSHAVRARNRLLVEAAPGDLLDAYDDTLAAAGAAILEARAAYIDAFSVLVRQNFLDICQPAPSLGVRYSSGLGAIDGGIEALTGRLYAALVERRERDRYRKTTGVGPHLDDVVFTLDGQQFRQRASQGQHRALVLAIKLAEIRYLTDVLGESPVLLLDDISSELDKIRTEQLFQTLAELDAQVILTTTDLSALRVLPHFDNARVYEVTDGSLHET